MSDYIVPLLFIAVFAAGLFKKVRCYDAFVLGAKQGLSLGLDIFPYLATMMLAIALMRVSGLDKVISSFLSPAFALIGIPPELTELIFLRPFSGSGSLALLNDIYAKYGVDTYIGRCASVIMGTTETVFYISGVYFAKTDIKKLGCALPVSLFCSVVGCILTCLLCKIM